jgi:hypothetical protein
VIESSSGIASRVLSRRSEWRVVDGHDDEYGQPVGAGPNVASSAGRRVTETPSDQTVEKIMKRPIFERRVSWHV